MTVVSILAIMPSGGFSFSCRGCGRTTIVANPNEDDPGVLIHTFQDSVLAYSPWGNIIHDCSSHTKWECTKCHNMVSTEDQQLIQGHTRSRKGFFIPMAICPRCASAMKIVRSA